MAGDESAPNERARVAMEIHSITEASEIRTFRMHETIQVSYRDLPEAATTTELFIEAVKEPPAIRTRSTSDRSASSEILMIDDQIWTASEGDWQRSDAGCDSSCSTRDAYLELGNMSLVAPLKVQAVIAIARVVGEEDIDKRQTMHLVAETDDILPLLMEDYRARLDSASSGEALDTAPPDSYITRYDVDLWVDDNGYVIMERTVVEYNEERLHGGQIAGTGPATTTTIRRFYDFNADIRIDQPGG